MSTEHSPRWKSEELPYSDDPIGAGLARAVALRLEQIRDQKGPWDQPPVLALIIREDVAVEDAVANHGMPGPPPDHDAMYMRLMFLDMPLPDEVWEGRAPVDVIEWMIEFYNTRTERLHEDANIIGVAFRAEAWLALRNPDELDPTDESFVAPSNDPERIEVRVMAAVDGVTGSVFTAVHRRDTEEIISEQDLVPDAPDGTRSLDGMIPAALLELSRAIMDHGHTN